VIAGVALFLTVDLAFFAANLTKVQHGGWFPLTIAFVVYMVLMTWQKGREIVTRNRTEEEGPLRAFVEELRTLEPPVYRAPGTGVFLNATKETTPLAMRANVEHNNTLHRSAVIISIHTRNVPHVAEHDQVTIDDLGYQDDGISHVSAQLGFQDDIDVPRILRLAVRRGLEGQCDPNTASYFLSRMTIVLTDAPGMARWRKKLFLAVARNASDPVVYFGLPDDRTVAMGSHVKF
jgi:KUP system potassium uptake protein